MHRLAALLLMITAAIVARGAPVVLRDIPYVTHPGTESKLTSLDIYLPETKPKSPAPVIILMHGGGWSIGDKTNATFIEPKASWFMDQGFIVVSINYRLSPAVTHPAHIEDVDASIAWVERHIAKHGGDPRKLWLLGHSAGAHLAALAGTDQERLTKAGAHPEFLQGVILLDGAGYDIPRQMLPMTDQGLLGRMYHDAFTSDVKIQTDASPALEHPKNPPPFLILHVARREDSKTQSDLLAAALRNAGGSVTVQGIAGKSHMTINRDLGVPGDPVTVAVAAFLKKHPLQ